MDRSNLRILYWNPGGVRDKVSALRTLAQDQDVHVILLGETKLKPTQQLRVPNYLTYRRDEVSPRGTAYRGTAALVRGDLVHEDLAHLEFSDIRTTGVRVSMAGREVKLFAGYRPPQPTFDTRDLRRIFEGRAPTLLAADLNAKHTAWGSRLVTPVGRRLLEDAETHGYTVIGPDSPTHVPNNATWQPDVLDIVAHQGLTCPVSLEVLYDLDEQHLPVLITLAIGADFTAPRPMRLRVNWDKFQAQLQEVEVGPLSTAEDVERCATTITDRIKSAKEMASTPAPPTQRREQMPLRLRAMHRKKRCLRKLWAHSRCPRVKRELNTLAEKLKSEVQAWRGESWDDRIIEIGEDPTKASLYQLNRTLTQAKVAVCPLLDGTGQRRYRAEERAELLADHLEGQFQLHPVPMDAAVTVPAHHQMVEAAVAVFLSSPPPPLEGNDFISPAEVLRAVRRLPGKKAPGHDGITNVMLKQLPTRGLVALARLFNGILRTQHFPKEWKTGKVIVLPKPGKDRRLPASYRPITLLPMLSKLFEGLLLRRLRPHLTPREEQFGFRTRHSTTLQLTRVIHLLAEGMNRGHRTVGVFLDIEKAFDRVWHEGLLWKLTQTTTPPAITRIVASFLERRDFFVAVEGHASTKRPTHAGVPQGSCLSPALYVLYTDDIPVLESEHLREGERDVTLALFADDSAYFASSKMATIAANRVQRVLELLPEWLDKWRMAVNVGKTAALLTGGQRILPPPLQLRGKDVKWESTVRYLGVHIDRTLRMRPQVDHAVRQAKAARALLRPVLASKLPLRTKVGVYKAYIRTRLTYAAPAWYSLCSETQRRRLQVVQNVALRVCTGAGRYVRNDVIARDVGVEKVGEFVVRLARRMYDRADNGPHPHLHDIAPLHARPPDKPQKRALPRDILPPPEEDEEGRGDYQREKKRSNTEPLRGAPTSGAATSGLPVPRG